ncbi:MAG: hypothetical protein ACKVUT_09525 [Gaiella sp.]
MSLKEQFSAEEWTKVSHTPFLVSAAVGIADPSGPFGMIKEGVALGKAVKRAMDGAEGELAKAIAIELREHRPSRIDLVGDGPRSKAEAHANAIEALKAAVELAESKASTHAPGLKAWLREIADEIAGAAEEGGFLGIGGEAISEGEAVVVEAIKAALV